jgi:uncharacterized membrane protein YfcA
VTVPLETIFWAGCIITVAYVVYGLTGFGASIVAIPLLALLFPLRFSVPMMVVFDLGAGLIVGWRGRGRIETTELRRLIPYMLVGVGLGATVLVKASDRWLLLTLAVFLIGYASWSLAWPSGDRRIGPRWAAPLGTLGGMFAATFGTGGPLFAIYLARRLSDKSTLRTTLSSMVTIAGVARLAVFAVAGLYLQSGLLIVAASLAPFALGGLFIGSKAHGALPAQGMVKVILVLLIVSGLNLLRRVSGMS